MLGTPQIITTDAQDAAVIHLAIPRSEMMTQFGSAVSELMSALAVQRVETVGPVFAHHLETSPDTFDFELGIVVSGPLKAAGRVRPGQLPAAKVVRAVYSGSYEGLSAAWSELSVWMRTNGYEEAENLWEIYSVGPKSSPDPASWRTELNRPIAC